MRTLKLAAVASLLFMLLPLACKDDVVNPTKEFDPGILRTDEQGNILGGDSTDWCWRSTAGSFSFGPAYPNPIHSPSFNIKFTVPVRDKVKIYFLENTSDTIYVENDTLLAGYYTYTVNVSNFFTASYWRLYMQCNAYSASDSCKNYGDIKFEP
jgi:hypothetical protein